MSNVDPMGRPRKVHKCSPQPNMCLHVAHYRDNEWWEVEEIPGHPPGYYGPYPKEDPQP